MLNKRKITQCFLSLLLAAVLSLSVLPVQTQAAGNTQSDRIIVSLGDSYSSGEGIEPFYGQDLQFDDRIHNNDWIAHRSSNAWSGMLKLDGVNRSMSKNRGTHWFFAASSGATTKHLLRMQKKTVKKVDLYPNGAINFSQSAFHIKYLPAQLDIFGELGEKRADYVTITIGGNDADFTGIVADVIIGSTYLNLSDLENKLEETWDLFYKDGGIRDNLYSSYKEIALRAGPQATILVVGYPKLFDSTGRGLPVSLEEAEMVNEAVTKFNNEIEKLVIQCSKEGMNICFVSVEEAFEGHEAYSAEPYINELMLGTKEQDINDVDVKSAYSMHPNYQGACVYAGCVQAAIDDLEEKRGLTIPSMDSTDSTEALYMRFLLQHPEYKYYALLDINADGVQELLAAETVNDANDEYYASDYVDMYVIRDGAVTLGYSDIWAKYDQLLYDPTNRWIATVHGGTGGGGATFIYLDEQLNTVETSFDAHLLEYDAQGNQVWEYYYNGALITDGNMDAYYSLVDRWDIDNAYNIPFRPITTDAADLSGQVWLVKNKVVETRDIVMTYSYEYTDDGQIKTYEVINEFKNESITPSGYYARYEYEYDDNGRIKAAHIDLDGEQTVFEYVYDDKGSLTCFMRDGESTEQMLKIECDAQGRIISLASIDDGQIAIKYSYHDNGALKMMDVGPMLDQVVVNYYDEQGNAIRSETNLDNRIISLSEKVYDAGRLIEERIETHPSEWDSSVITYRYSYENGMLAACEIEIEMNDESYIVHMKGENGVLKYAGIDTNLDVPEDEKDLPEEMTKDLRIVWRCDPYGNVTEQTMELGGLGTTITTTEYVLVELPYGTHVPNINEPKYMLMSGG